MHPNFLATATRTLAQHYLDVEKKADENRLRV